MNTDTRTYDVIYNGRKFAKPTDHKWYVQTANAEFVDRLLSLEIGESLATQYTSGPVVIRLRTK